MEHEALRNCSCKVYRILLPTMALTNANLAAAWAGHTRVMRPWHHVPWCQLAGWLQLCSRPNSHSCAPPASGEKECSRERDTHSSPSDVETSLLWIQTDPVCPLGWVVACQRKEQITDKKQGEKKNQRNTWSWIFRYKHRTLSTRKHVLLLPSEGQRGMGKGILNQAEWIPILTLLTRLQYNLQFL